MALLAGDRRETNEFVDWALPRVCRTIQSGFRRVDASAINDAAEDAILRYLARPAIWRPPRGGLLTFLVAVARKRLLTGLSGKRRRERHDQEYVALQLSSTGPPGKSNRASQIEPLLRGAATTLEEQRFVELLLDGERRAKVYTRALGITALPLGEQRRQVNRVRARLLMRVKRALPQPSKGGRR